VPWKIVASFSPLQLTENTFDNLHALSFLILAASTFTQDKTEQVV